MWRSWERGWFGTIRPQVRTLSLGPYRVFITDLSYGHSFFCFPHNRILLWVICGTWGLLLFIISLSGFCRPDILGDESMLTLREEILNLLESPELLEYLLSNPERLCEFDYANIIAGAPIGLAEKRALLEKLKNSAELRREPDKVADYIAALDFATAALENSGNETVMSVVLRRCGVDSFVDGAYYAASAESARRAIREYVSECSDCDWGHMYWEMKLYRRSDASESGGFMRTEYIYIAEPNGEIQYFLHNYGRRGKTKYYTRAEEAFGERSAI